MVRALRPEFRIPISPTEGFFAQVRFFDAAMRRLGGAYSRARLHVVVGDNCDIEMVRNSNRWSIGRNVIWSKVPNKVFDRFGIHGTANWRYVLPVEDADLVIMCDADTVLVRDIDPLLSMLDLNRPSIAGHMAHYPPPDDSGGQLPSPQEDDFWPALFQAFDIVPPNCCHRYSMDQNEEFPLAPPYFNLGFIALTTSAMGYFAQDIFNVEQALIDLMDNHMRCQIACTIIGHLYKMDIRLLSAAYNAANDIGHFQQNMLVEKSVRVLHYLRTEEIDRSNIFLPEVLPVFLEAPLVNPLNRLLQRLAQELSPVLMGSEWGR